MAVFPDPALMVLTDRTRLTPQWTIAQAVAPAITGGANVVVLQETDVPAAHRRTIARFVRDGIKGRVPFILAGEPEFALELEADGVHLEHLDYEVTGTFDARVAQARSVLGDRRLIGITVSSLDAARAAGGGGADYVLIYLDWSDGDAAIRTVAAYAPIVRRLIAGPDVPLEHAAACRAAGAAGIAVIEAGMSAYNRTEALGKYRAALEGDPDFASVQGTSAKA
jgi:thiamine-phosphate pyrophosphorylase